MTNEKSDKPLVRNLIIGCVIAILIFHFAWANQYFTNLRNSYFFLIVDFFLLGAFTASSINAYKYADEPNKDKKRYWVIGIALVSCIWAAGWSAGLNERVGL